MTVTVKRNAALVVPPSIRRKAGLKAGDRVDFKVANGVITIVPELPVVDEEYTTEQRRIIDARLAKADEDIKHGRVYGPFDTAEEMAASLEAEIKKRRSEKLKAKRAR
jgi:AbrB family looped-hinge helix DNA binding protein